MTNNDKISPKLLSHNNEGFSVNTIINDNLNNQYLLNTSVRSSSSWSSSILLGLGISYDMNIALIDVNLFGHFSLGNLYRGYYTTTSSNKTTVSYGLEQSGTYYGMGIAIYPKMFWEKICKIFIKNLKLS